MLLHTWAPQVLRAAGLAVVETGGWTGRSHGSFPDSISGIHHHDASPPGDSPGALNWMISNWPNASANFWVNRQGVWYCVGTGVAYHAGAVVAGMPNNFNSFGVETDQTINETPSPAMLEAVRIGFAVLLKHMGRNSSSYYFHKTIAPNRKQDPWLGQSSANSTNWPVEIVVKRGELQREMDGSNTGGGNIPNKPDPQPEPNPPVPEFDEEWEMLKLAVVHSSESNSGAIFAYGPNRFFHVENDSHLAVGQAAGVLPTDRSKDLKVSKGDLDILRDVCIGSPDGKDQNYTQGVPSSIT